LVCTILGRGFMPEAGLFFAACERFAADIYWMSYELASVRVPSAKPAEPDRQVVHCRHCRSMADLLVRMVDPKDGRILSVFRCRCEKLTTTSDQASHTHTAFVEQD
jgi:hypothetical protein